eukprot:8798764-Pyramimonas_sp.AAC.1
MYYGAHCPYYCTTCKVKLRGPRHVVQFNVRRACPVHVIVPSFVLSAPALYWHCALLSPLLQGLILTGWGARSLRPKVSPPHG